MQKTKFKTISDLRPVWYLIDAKDKILGRIAVEVADKLNGKNLPGISPNQYCQSKVVVINTNQVKTTGNKLTNKVYIHHTGFPKGLRSITLGEAMQKDSTEVFRKAVKGMLPKNKLQKKKMAGLFVYKDADHEHKANFGKVAK